MPSLLKPSPYSVFLDQHLISFPFPFICLVSKRDTLLYICMYFSLSVYLIIMIIIIVFGLLFFLWHKLWAIKKVKWMQNVTDETVCVCARMPHGELPSKLPFSTEFFPSLKTPTRLTDPMDPWSKNEFHFFFCIEIIRMSLQCTHYSWDKKCIYLKNENVYYHLNYYLCQKYPS